MLGGMYRRRDARSIARSPPARDARIRVAPHIALSPSYAHVMLTSRTSSMSSTSERRTSLWCTYTTTCTDPYTGIYAKHHATCGVDVQTTGAYSCICIYHTEKIIFAQSHLSMRSLVNNNQFDGGFNSIAMCVLLSASRE